MKAILSFTDCMNDSKKVFGVLTANNIQILKTKHKPDSIHPYVAIRVANLNELKDVLYELNQQTLYGVEMVRFASERSLAERIKRFFE